MSRYFRDLADAVISTLKGMGVTLKHLFSKPVTVQYPDERLPVSDGYRGKHRLVQGGCRVCTLCAKACPVECIDIEYERHMKRVIEFKRFTIDYNRCVFCGLCIEACKPGVLEMTKDFDLSTEDRRDAVRDLLEWHGLREEDLENIRLLKEEDEKKRKAAEEAAAQSGGAGGAASGAASGAAGAASAGADPAGEGAQADEPSAKKKAPSRKKDGKKE